MSIPGHYAWTLNDPIFEQVLLRGIGWQPVLALGDFRFSHKGGELVNEDYDDFLKARIFTPAGMAHTRANSF